MAFYSACVLFFLCEIMRAAVPTAAVSITPGDSRCDTEREAATRLQLFLDRAEFAPGKIDGRYGEFTLKALTLYRQAHGLIAPSPKQTTLDSPGSAPPDPTPDTTGLDLGSIDPVFIHYTVTEQDLQLVGELPGSIAEQAKLKWLPYKTAAEAIAEKFHVAVNFLAELNIGKIQHIHAGDILLVPNTPPFDGFTIKDLQAAPALTAETFTGDPKSDPRPNTVWDQSDVTAETRSMRIDTRENMLTVYHGEKLVAAYPVTVGSTLTESPVGDWTIRAIAKLPIFRYDEAMLNRGERSSHFHQLPPGPNSPVGVLWIELNRNGIGLHGTNEPDTIGRSASHGCVRLANWDIVRLAPKVNVGVPVSIR